MTPEEINALIEQKVAERTAHLTAHVEQLVKEKRKLVADRKPDVLEESRRVMAAADRYLAGQIDNGTSQYATNAVKIPRNAPHAEYVRLKTEAEKRGVPYVIEDTAVDPALANNARGAPSPVRYVEDEKTFWAHQEMQREVGIVELNRRASAAGKTLRIFKSAEDLSPDARARHDRIVEAGDPDNLLLKSE